MAYSGHWIVGALISLAIVYKLVSSFKYKRAVARLGCSPVSRYPHKDPILGYDLHHLLQRSKAENGLNPTLQQLYSEVGKGQTFQALTWGIQTVYTINTENVKAVLTADFGSFGVEAIRKAFSDPWIGGGIMMSDGLIWKTSRAMVKPSLSKSHFWDMHEFSEQVNRLLAKIPTDGTTVDLQPLFFYFYLDVSTKLLLGESTDSQTSCPRIDVPRFFKSMEHALQGVQRRVALGPILPIVPRDRQWEKTCNEVNGFFDQYINVAMAKRLTTPTHVNGKLNQESRSTERLSVLSELANQSEDPLYVRDQLLSVFLPLHNSGPIVISDVFFQVARTPAVYAKLRAEVLQMGNVELTFEVLKSMKYLQCVLRESLRLLSGLDRIIRICMHDCVLPRGGGDMGDQPIFVQRGTLIDTHISVLHRNPAFWGPDAEVFRPERWLDVSLRPTWEYIPFGGGARNCPAQQMILTHYAFILARFAQTFESIECRDEVWEFVAEFNFSKRSKNGVKVAFRNASV